jgi:D-glycero-D-manno-heptose 1,7-bisphosphate phosphatase
VAYNNKMFPAVFLDRDGVLVENRDEYIREWSHVKIIPKILEALTGFQREGFKIVVVTNQSAIGRGLVSTSSAQEISDRLVKTIKENGGWIDAVYICPHTPEDQCLCRKPKPGMLLQAAQELSLDLASSWMIGDAWSDLQAGQAAGVRGTIMVRTGRGSAQLRETKPENITPILVCEDLFEACNIVGQVLKGASSGPNLY